MNTPTQEAQALKLGDDLKQQIQFANDLASSVAVHKRPSRTVEAEHKALVMVDRLVALASAQQANPWRTVIDDALVGSGLDCLGPDEDPKAALNRLLAWREEIAADPRVSDRARQVDQAEPDDASTWAQYVAGMVIAYLGGPVDDARIKLIAGIIERRLKFLASPAPREVQPLTYEQITQVYGSWADTKGTTHADLMRATERACATAWGVKLADQTKEQSHD